MNAATRGSRRAGAAALVVVLLAAFALPAAAADELAAAKDAGYVGERLDGTLGLVDADAPASVVQLVERVNRQRRAHYEAIAKKNGTSVAAVAALAGQKAIEKTAPGHYVQNARGEWVAK